MSSESSIFEAIKNAVNDGQVLWKKHALERMMERGISRALVKQAIVNGVIIETYPNDNPIPSMLIAYNHQEALHVVLAYEAENQYCHIITTYRPDLAHFENDFITRRLS